MSAKIAIICDPHRFSAKLQAWGRKLFRRSVHRDLPYHCAWVTDDAMYDMNWCFRKIPRDSYKNRIIHLFDAPVTVTQDYLENMVGKRYYGVFDVLFYPLYQLFGFNAWGTHCSEALNDDMWFNGYRTPWIPYGAAPDPNDMILWLESVK